MRLQFWRSRPGVGEGESRETEANTLGTELDALRERFGKRMREDFTVLTRYRALQSPPADELVSTVHRLAGAAGMLGFTEISTVAARLDDEFAESDANAGSTLAELLRILEQTITPPGKSR